MKTLKSILILAALSLPLMAQQTPLTQTTLLNSLPGAVQGLAGTSTLYVASATGFNPQAQPNQVIIVDREAMLLVLPASTGQPATTLTVIRGISGTGVSAHVAGAVVYVGPPAAFSLAGDPFGMCVAANVPFVPQISLMTGNVSVCTTFGVWARQITIPESTSFTRTLVAAAYTILPTDEVVAVTTGSAITVTLPAAATLPGKTYVVKDESGGAGTNTLTVAGTIDGGTNKTITTAYGALRVYSNGVNWFTW